MPHYPRLQVSIFAGAFVFGIVMSSLGALLPVLTSSLGLDKATAGSLFLGMNFAMLVGSLVFGPVCDRFGFRLLLLASTLLIGGAFLVLSGAANHAAILPALILLGLGGGTLNGGANALLNDISPERRQSALNLLGIFFGCGALFTPFAIGALLGAVGLRAILAGLGFLTAAPFVLFVRARFPGAKHQAGFKSGELRSVLASPLLYLFGLLLFFQSGNEFTVGGWVSTLLQEQHDMGPRAAAYTLTAYWAAIMAGRLVASRIGARAASPLMVVSGALVALAASVGLILSRSSFAAIVWVALAGLGFAPIFPTALAQAGARFAGYSGTAFSAIFVMALGGGMTAPWLVGRIAQSGGIGAGFWVTVVSCGAIALLQVIIAGASRSQGAPPDPGMDVGVTQNPSPSSVAASSASGSSSSTTKCRNSGRSG